MLASIANTHAQHHMEAFNDRFMFNIMFHNLNPKWHSNELDCSLLVCYGMHILHTHTHTRSSRKSNPTKFAANYSIETIHKFNKTL